MAKLIEAGRSWDKEILKLDKLSMKPFFDKLFGKDGKPAQVDLILT